MTVSRSFSPSPLVKGFSSLLNIIWMCGIFFAGISVVILPIGLSGGFLRGGLFNLSARWNFISEKGPLLLGGIYLSSLFIWAIFLWIVFHLRLLMRSVIGGKPFSQKNPMMIRRIAYAVLAWAVADGLFYYLKGALIIRTTAYPGMGLDMISELIFKIFLEFIFLGLGILVIAHTFDVGVRLQRDQDLTI
jgi:hypothetical protein